MTNLDEQLDAIDYAIQVNQQSAPMGYPDDTVLTNMRLRLTTHAKDTIKAIIANQLNKEKI